MLKTKQVHAEKFIIKHQNLYAPCKMHPRSSGQLEPLVRRHKDKKLSHKDDFILLQYLF
jgi:hypothetical protein